MTEKARGAEFAGEEPREEIHSSELTIGDVLVIETASGSSYRLEITDTDDSPKGVLCRWSDHDVKGEVDAWKKVESDNLFEFRGSCEGVLQTSPGKLTVAGEERDMLRVGKRAWLGTELDGEDRTLTTSEVKSVSKQGTGTVSQ